MSPAVLNITLPFAELRLILASQEFQAEDAEQIQSAGAGSCVLASTYEPILPELLPGACFVPGNWKRKKRWRGQQPVDLTLDAACRGRIFPQSPPENATLCHLLQSSANCAELGAQFHPQKIGRERRGLVWKGGDVDI